MNKFAFTSPFITTLKERSADRVSKDPEFRYISEDMKRFREKLDLNQLSLNEKIRKEELAQEKARKAERKKERKLHPVIEPVAYEVSLDTVDKPALPKVTIKKKPAGDKVTKDPDAEEDETDTAQAPDPIRHEAINIIQDLTSDIQNLRTAKTAQGG